jgi:hypothetical protein
LYNEPKNVALLYPSQTCSPMNANRIVDRVQGYNAAIVSRQKEKEPNNTLLVQDSLNPNILEYRRAFID